MAEWRLHYEPTIKQRVIPAAKECVACRRILPASAFQARPKMKSGLLSRCRECFATYLREYRAAHPDKRRAWNATSYAKDKAEPEKWRRRTRRINANARADRAHYLWMRAKCRAKKAGLPFDIEPSDVVVPKVCPVLGIALVDGKGSHCDGSPSLDRIVPALGYVKGNVMVISHRANRIKCDATKDELRKIADFYGRMAA